MIYYRLKTIGSHARGSDVVDSHGEPLEPVKELPNSVFYFYMDQDDPCPLGDLMSPGFNPLVVSTRAGEILSGFRCPPFTHFFPVTLLAVNFDGKIESREIVGEGCGILFDWPEDEVMTEEDTKVNKNSSPPDRVQGKTPPPVVQRHVIEPYDLYDGCGLGILVSERVKGAVDEAELTNFRFLPVETR